MPPPDEAADTSAVATPTGDALAGDAPAAVEGEPSASQPAADTDADPAAAALAVEQAKAKEAAEVEARRKKAREELLPEHKALREEKRAFKQAQAQFAQQRDAIVQRNQQVEAALRDAIANPFAFAARMKGVDESEIYNERTKRAIDPQAAELDSVKKELERDRQERARERAEMAARAQEAKKAEIERNFSAEVIHIAQSDKELRLLQLGLEEGEFKQENIAAEVFRRVQAAYHQSEQETGDGKILDSKEVLRTIESELREEAKRKAARLAKLAIPDREGAVESATHEASSKGPHTLTNAHASTTSGKPRTLTRRERMIEAEKALRGGSS